MVGQIIWFRPESNVEVSKLSLEKVLAMGIFSNLKIILTRGALVVQQGKISTLKRRYHCAFLAKYLKNR